MNKTATDPLRNGHNMTQNNSRRGCRGKAGSPTSAVASVLPGLHPRLDAATLSGGEPLPGGRGASGMEPVRASNPTQQRRASFFCASLTVPLMTDPCVGCFIPVFLFYGPWILHTEKFAIAFSSDWEWSEYCVLRKVRGLR